MASGNGDKAEGQRVKKCPLLGGWCIKEECALWAEMTRVQGGLQQKFGMCSFAGMMMILSEMNAKTQPPQQKINISDIIKRRG